MKVDINNRRRIADIQESFRKLFPYLTIGFFTHYKNLENATLGNGVSGLRTLGQCRTIHSSGEMTVTPVMTVREVEEIFRTRYGLHVKVFRQSGKAWLETSRTNDWTLEEQNREGELLSAMK